jgi:hypothetical protein
MSSPAAGISMLENRAARQIEEDELGFIDEGDNPVFDHDFADGEDQEPLLFSGDAGTGGRAKGIPLSCLRSQRSEWRSPGPRPGYQHELSAKLDAIARQGLDHKVKELIRLVKKWQKEGFNPIVYCRYIHTAEYVGAALREALPKKVGVATVTSKLADEAREEAVEKLGESPVRVLIATDCMSEGINLQRHFTAVIHYDLPWNPNRLEQREGRVDRFGQAAPEVRTALMYGKDNPMDGIVLKVLLRKAREIKKAIGVSVPFPENNQSILEAVTQAVLLRKAPITDGKQLGMFDNLPEVAAGAHELDVAYRKIGDIEKATRSIFAQHAVKAQEIDQDLDQAIRLIGNMESVEQFTLAAIRHLGGNYSPQGDGYRIDKTGLPFSLHHLFGERQHLDVSFATPTPEGFRYVARNHPLVDTLGQLLMDEALTGGRASAEYRVRRTAVVRTGAVTETTTVLLLRVRNVIESLATRRQLVAEELLLKAYRGVPPDEVEWLEEADALALLQTEATAEVPEREKTEYLEDALEDVQGPLKEVLNGFGREQAERLVEAHDRFRAAVKGKRFQVVEPILPMDVMGVYVFVPDLT